MRKHLLTTACLAVALWATAGDASAQTPGTTQAPAADKQAEIQQITARLGELQKPALQDPAVQAANDSVTAAIEAALKTDQAYQQLAQQAEQYKADVAAAQAAGDNEKLSQLADQGKLLQQGMNVSRRKAMSDPAVQKQMEAYKARLFEKMVEIDPQAKTLAQRLGELNS